MNRVFDKFKQTARGAKDIAAEISSESRKAAADMYGRPAPAPDAAPRSSVGGVSPGRLLNGHAPDGDPATAWDRRRAEYKLVGTGNRRKFHVVVVGTGLAGSGAAASLAELGFNVTAITYHDAARRAHSVAAQGGINAARGRKVDGDSVRRFVVDTIKGGDFRAREADAYRLAQESVRVIDHMNAIGVPFGREYGGSLATRSFGGVQVSRTYYSRGQTGQQLQIAGAQALLRQVNAGRVTLRNRTEVLDYVMDEGRVAGVVVRDLVTGAIAPILADAVVLATGGYGSIYYKSTLAVTSNASASWRAHQRGALFANPSFIQFHPTALPAPSPAQAKNTLMSESLRNDGRMWVPKDGSDTRAPNDIPDADRDYYLERMYPAFGNLTPRDIASRAATAQLRAGHGVGPAKNSVYLDFRDALERLGREELSRRYGNLFDMYADATGEDPYSTPMRIAPAAHFTMGGLWSDYDLATSLPGLFVAGESGWGYHGANRLGANSLLSACVDGWFTIPNSVGNYLAGRLGAAKLDEDAHGVGAAVDRARSRTAALVDVGGSVPPRVFHQRLGEILTEGAGVERSRGSLLAAREAVVALRLEFWRDVGVPGSGEELSIALEQAGRVADFLELGELLCVDALDREESCGAHYRSEYSREGEAVRNDDDWAFVSAWESGASAGTFIRHAEPLTFNAVPLATRNYE